MQKAKAAQFHSLHTSDKPLALYNIWDAGSAKAVAEAGAQAIATGSWSVAAAQGFEDGESLPLDFAVMIYDRIIRSTNLPVTVDFEGGYAETPQGVAANVAKLIKAGAAGINFEDQIVGDDGLYSTDDQCARIAAIRAAAEGLGMPLFINARTDLFLKADEGADHTGLLEQAKVRVEAYAAAGASGFFAPALKEATLIKELCAASPIPVNIMMMDGVPPIEDLAALGVKRVSFGPGPYVDAASILTGKAAAALA